MPGRNALPVDILKARGKTHITKKEIEARKASEVKLGANDLRKLDAPPQVKNDATAYRYWKQHITEYQAAADKGIEILTSSDVGTLALYCVTFSEWEQLQRVKQRLDAAADKLLGSDDDDLLGPADDPATALTKMLYSVDGLLKLESAINKKMDMLLKMQDRLFLNPLSKVKNVPKPAKEKQKNPLEEAGFEL